MLHASLCAKIMVFRRITRIIGIVLNERTVLERASDGGYYAWLTVNMQCNAYGESPEEAVLNLQETMNEMIDEMYMVEEFI